MSKNKNDYFKDDENLIDVQRQERRKRAKTRKNTKIILGLIAVLICVLVAVGIVINRFVPNFDFTAYLPKTVVDFVDDKLTREEKTTVAETTTIPETTLEMMDYIEFDDFDFNTDVQGNTVGSILNGGYVATDLSYIYHYVDGKGVYRFAPSTEAYSCMLSTSDKITCLNLRGGYIYYVNKSNNALYRLSKESKKSEKLSDNVSVAYVYDNYAYYLTNNGKICVMDLTTLVPVTAYYSNGKDISFVGISLSRVFFTETDSTGKVRYLTVDNFAHSTVKEFRSPTTKDDIKNIILENGFFYYYKKQYNNTYDLCRQKYGSDKVITLVKDVTSNNFVEINSNRLYYSNLKNGVYSLKEINMNNDDEKLILYTENVGNDNQLSFYTAGEYNFVIGNKIENNYYAYMASSIYTSSNNIMYFSNDSWHY